MSCSLYDLEIPELMEKFDIVYFVGVIYHLSDPMLALRILYNRLRVGGIIIVESLGPPGSEPLTYDRISNENNNYFLLSPDVLKDMLEDVGFSDIKAFHFRRTEAIARKASRKPMKTVGLSRRDVC